MSDARANPYTTEDLLLLRRVLRLSLVLALTVDCVRAGAAGGHALLLLSLMLVIV